MAKVTTKQDQIDEATMAIKAGGSGSGQKGGCMPGRWTGLQQSGCGRGPHSMAGYCALGGGPAAV